MRNTSHPIQILLHGPHPWTPLPNLEVHPPPPPNSSPNFKATTLLQSLLSSIPKRQSYFPNKALLKVVKFLIPKPPLAIGKHTLSQPNKCILESPHKKSLCSFSILFATCMGVECDSSHWCLNGNGEFDIRSYYNKIRGASISSFPWKGILKVKVPKREAFFVDSSSWANPYLR